MYANRMRTFFESALIKSESERAEATDDPAEILRRAMMFTAGDPGIFMSYWYGGLYVVVEGWRELKLSDPVIDELLLSPNVEHLRLYRNGTFHFQKSYFDDRFAGFLNSQDSVPWVRKLSSSFGGYFLSEAAKSGNAEALKYYNADGSERTVRGP
jgi:hypothetical protein